MACSCLKVYAGIVATLGLKETREREKKVKNINFALQILVLTLKL